MYAQHGLGMKRDYDLARKYYRLGALESDAYCYCQLGVMYVLGYGVKKDAHAALDYYMQAAEMGDALCYCNVAWLYESGELGKPDLQTAIKWYKKGAIRKEEHTIEALKRLNVPFEK